MKLRVVCLVFLILLVVLVSVHSSYAQVQVVRSGQENPVVTIGKSTLYGAGTGLLLGLALSLVINEDTGDVVKWSFVTGTFGGFFLGVYHVASRPSASSALLQFEGGRLAKVRFPEPQIRWLRSRQMEFRVSLVSVSL